jgi:Plasmid encoded RepA protein
MEKLGDIIGNSRAVRKATSLTPAMEKLIQAAVQIQAEPDDDDRAFMARELVQCTLPHSDPGQVPFWARTNGNVTLSISSGLDARKMKLVGYPYGSIPRLILFWLTTEALRAKSKGGGRRLHLGNSYNEFLRDVGFDPNTGGGKRGDGRRVKEQTRRLFSASISFIQNVEMAGLEGERRLNMPVADTSELWWDPKRPDQVNLWDSWVELGEKFWEALTTAPVPLDIRALRALKRSPLALDLYAWSTHKAFSVSRKGKPQYVPWKMLAEQFGGDYANHLDFKKKAKDAFRKILIVYPGLKLSDATPGGITVLATSRPAVIAQPSKRGLIG